MNVMSLVTTIASAFVVSFVTVVIPSPSTVTAGRYGVRYGTRAAAVFLGAVLILDSVVFLVLAFGFHPFLSAVGAARYLAPLAGIGLVAVGLVMVVTAHRDGSRLVSMSARSESKIGGTTRGPFLAGLLVPVANPGFWIWWTTVGTSFIHAARHWGGLGLGLLLVALLGGAAAWYVLLLWAFNRGRQVLSERIQDRVLIVLGLIMIGFGMVLVWRMAVAFG